MKDKLQLQEESGRNLQEIDDLQIRNEQLCQKLDLFGHFEKQ